eukprot:6074891-Alexandrium_andersonii.AAC.1
MQFPSPLAWWDRLRGAGARKRGPAARGRGDRAQLIPAEPAQPWGARRSSVPPVQIGEPHVAIDH